MFNCSLSIAQSFNYWRCALGLHRNRDNYTCLKRNIWLKLRCILGWHLYNYKEHFRPHGISDRLLPNSKQLTEECFICGYVRMVGGK